MRGEARGRWWAFASGSVLVAGLWGILRGSASELHSDEPERPLSLMPQPLLRRDRAAVGGDCGTNAVLAFLSHAQDEIAALVDRGELEQAFLRTKAAAELWALETPLTTDRGCAPDVARRLLGKMRQSTTAAVTGLALIDAVRLWRPAGLWALASEEPFSDSLYLRHELLRVLAGAADAVAELRRAALTESSAPLSAQALQSLIRCGDGRWVGTWLAAHAAGIPREFAPLVQDYLRTEGGASDETLLSLLRAEPRAVVAATLSGLQEGGVTDDAVLEEIVRLACDPNALGVSLEAVDVVRQSQDVDASAALSSIALNSECAASTRIAALAAASQGEGVAGADVAALTAADLATESGDPWAAYEAVELSFRLDAKVQACRFLHAWATLRPETVTQLSEYLLGSRNAPVQAMSINCLTK